jgi:hypothetical protein
VSAILPILAMIVTAVVTLMAVVFCMSMGANATPRAITILKLWMLGLTLLGLAGIVIGIVLLRDGQSGRAIFAALSPVAVILVIFVVAIATSGR